MKEDFAFRRTRQEDEMMYRPNYKPAEELKVDTVVTGLKNVTDFDSFNTKMTAKKRRQLE